MNAEHHIHSPVEQPLVQKACPVGLILGDRYFQAIQCSDPVKTLFKPIKCVAGSTESKKGIVQDHRIETAIDYIGWGQRDRPVDIPTRCSFTGVVIYDLVRDVA